MLRRFVLAVGALLALPVLADPTAPPSADPLAGYNGSFFLRDPNSWFVLFPKGRLQIDSYNFLNRGDPPNGANGLPVDANSKGDKRPNGTLLVRRARIELQGTMARHFDFQIAAEYASTPAVGSTGTVSDAWVNVNYTPYLQLRVGQFDAPFTLENCTSDKFFDFMERSLAIRAFAVPQNKELGAMLWGYLPNRLAYYSLGFFNGEGQNFKNQDSHYALIGRAFVAPLATLAGDRDWLKEMWLGGSIWYQTAVNQGGRVAPSVSGATQNDLPLLTTQGGFGFFAADYDNGKDPSGAAIRSHLAPSGDTLKWAVEANLPVKQFGARLELVHQTIHLAQYNDTNPTNATLLRSPVFSDAQELSGTGYYVELYGWLLGHRKVIESPGLGLPPRLSTLAPVKEPTWALMVAAKLEHVGFDVVGLPMPNGMVDPAQGHHGIDAVELGVNGWLTKHVRLTANYVVNFIGGFSSDESDAKNMKSNLFYQRAEHELLFRLGIGL